MTVTIKLLRTRCEVRQESCLEGEGNGEKKIKLKKGG